MATIEVCPRFRFYSISTGIFHGSTKFQGFFKTLGIDKSESICRSIPQALERLQQFSL